MARAPAPLTPHQVQRLRLKYNIQLKAEGLETIKGREITKNLKGPSSKKRPRR